MHKIIFTAAIACSLIACNNEKKPTVEAKDAAATTPIIDSATAVVYKLDSTISTLQWEGYEGLALGKSEHNGSLVINSGIIQVKNNLPVSGKFLIPINSLKVADIPVEKPGNAKLVKHLLDTDFFDAAKFPEAAFEITNAITNGTDSVNITGNLTLKDVSKSITVPAAIKMVDNTFTAITPKFYINRKDWGMFYKSENSLGDEMIRPEMGITLNITAKK
jgi:polyisoprenoid-binding protein YceI